MSSIETYQWVGIDQEVGTKIVRTAWDTTTEPSLLAEMETQAFPYLEQAGTLHADVGLAR